jgi:hypothetical protein
MQGMHRARLIVRLRLFVFLLRRGFMPRARHPWRRACGAGGRLAAPDIGTLGLRAMRLHGWLRGPSQRIGLTDQARSSASGSLSPRWRFVSAIVASSGGKRSLLI